MKKRLGEILLERQLLSVDQLNIALAHQRQWNMRLGAALVAKGFITERNLTHVLAESLGIPLVDLSKIIVDAKAMAAVPVEVCEQHDLFPVALKHQKGRPFLVLAMADPLNFGAIDEISFSTGCKVQPAIALLSSVGQAIRRFYYEQRAVVITPLEGETPLSRSGRPVGAPSNDMELPPSRSMDLPPPLVTNAEFLADVERPALGGPGQAPVAPPPAPSPVTTGASMAAAPKSGSFSAAGIPGVTSPSLPSAPRTGSFAAAVAIPGVTGPSLPAAPPAARPPTGSAAPAPVLRSVAMPPAPVQAQPSPEEAPLAGTEVDELDGLPLIELTAEAETGTFLIASPSPHPATVLEEPVDAPEPKTLKALAANETESLEEKFWALMHVLNARGVVTKEEFLAQLRSHR